MNKRKRRDPLPCAARNLGAGVEKGGQGDQVALKCAFALATPVGIAPKPVINVRPIR
jgi:hypothetical protein